jgi:hypothetical protein
MATKKQRRRRAKEHRHEYVWVDDEGNEVEADGDPKVESAAAKGASRIQRDPQAPSWRRSLKRGLIFAPIMLGTVFLLSPDVATSQKVTQTALIVAIFIPFSYFIDRFFYRSFQRRRARNEQAAGRRGS